MAAAMGGLDALVFTGGVGEHAAAIRQRAADGLGFLGIAVDPAANRAEGPDREIGAERRRGEDAGGAGARGPGDRARRPSGARGRRASQVAVRAG